MADHFTRVDLRHSLAIHTPLGVYVPPEGPVVDLDKLNAKNRRPSESPGPLEQRVMELEASLFSGTTA